MVEVSASDSFLEVLEAFAADNKQLSQGERALILADLRTKHISLDSFRCLAKYRPDLNIHTAMRGSAVTIPFVSKAAESQKEEDAKKRLLERKAFLQVQHETREYNR